MWTCEDIHNISAEIIDEMDSNGDGMINAGDIDPEHLEALNMYCDYNGDG
jgi:hypothetical protein